MIQIDNKFEIGQEVYIVRKTRKKETCPACKGNGHIIIDGNRFSCTLCYGTGNLHAQKKTYQVIGKDTIDRIKTFSSKAYKESKEITTIVKYTFKDGNEYTDARLFLTEKEAKEECDKLNGIVKVEG